MEALTCRGFSLFGKECFFPFSNFPSLVLPLPTFQEVAFLTEKNYDVASFLAKRFAQATSFLLGSSMKMARVSPFFLTKADDEVLEGGVVSVVD